MPVRQYAKRTESAAFRNLTGALFGAFAFYIVSIPFGYDNKTARLILALASIPPFWVVLTACQRERNEPTTLLATLYFLFGLILPGMAHSALGQFPFYRSSYPEGDVLAGSLVVFLFSVSFFSPIALHRPPQLTSSEHRIRVNSFLLSILSSILAIIGLGIAVKVGLALFLSNRGDTTLRFVSFITVALCAVARFSTFSAFLMALYNFKTLGSRTFGAYMSLITTGAIALFVNYPLSLPRFVLLSYAISISIFMFPLGQRRFKRLIAVGYPLLIMTLFPALSVLTRGARGESILKDWGQYYTTSGDLDGFQSVINVVRWIDQDGLQFGKQILSAILAFVPRDFWPDKANPTGVSAALSNGYSFTNISAPLPAEVYSDFGWPGLIVGGALLGYLVAKADDHLGTAMKSRRPSGIISIALLAGFIAILFRGSLMAVITPCGLAILIAQFSRLAEFNRVTPSSRGNVRP